MRGGHYQQAALDEDDVYRSRALAGFWLRAGWLWQEPLPDEETALLQIDRETYTRYLRERLERAGE